MLTCHEGSNFLGHKLNRHGVKPAEQKVQAITNWPAPTSVKEVQVFLGAVGWYRKFIKILAQSLDH